ncbi:NAD(P)/FAD-dependent oxidoreductase [Halarchaeum acidiphilum]|uniref:NAD(P)/FAD-dependent oxidoreductase n=1 Tax=Halarchaeum acidiphilum TaxID=489138 RepID=UPI001F27A8C8|nr:FAD-dependent oxidoreductase [Halarchaeum acidiphilum]
MTARRVAVVGGGAVGLTAAYDLASRGADVVLYERDDLGAGSTARAAGIAYDAYAEDVDVALAERAIERFRAFSGAGDFRFAHTPYLWFVTEGGAAAGAIREQVERMRHHDRDVELLDADAIRREFPVLRADDIVAAGIARTAGTVDPVAYVDLLAAKAREAGADVRTGTPATVALDPPRVNGEAYDAVVVAAGAWTGGVLAEAGVDVPLEPIGCRRSSQTVRPSRSSTTRRGSITLARTRAGSSRATASRHPRTRTTTTATRTRPFASGRLRASASAS